MSLLIISYNHIAKFLHFQACVLIRFLYGDYKLISINFFFQERHMQHHTAEDDFLILIIKSNREFFLGDFKFIFVDHQP